MTNDILPILRMYGQSIVMKDLARAATWLSVFTLMIFSFHESKVYAALISLLPNIIFFHSEFNRLGMEKKRNIVISVVSGFLFAFTFCLHGTIFVYIAEYKTEIIDLIIIISVFRFIIFRNFIFFLKLEESIIIPVIFCALSDLIVSIPHRNSLVVYLLPITNFITMVLLVFAAKKIKTELIKAF